MEKRVFGSQMIKKVSWRRERVFCIEVLWRSQLNQEAIKSKDWGIWKALTCIYSISWVYTGHMHFHTFFFFFSPLSVQFTLKKQPNNVIFWKVFQLLLKTKPLKLPWKPNPFITLENALENLGCLTLICANFSASASVNPQRLSGVYLPHVDTDSLCNVCGKLGT